MLPTCTAKKLTILGVIMFDSFNITIFMFMLMIIFNWNNTPIVQVCEFVRVRINQWI